MLMTGKSQNRSQRIDYFLHRAAAAFLAISARFFALSLAARAGPPLSPPLRPRLTAAGSLPSVAGSAGASSVACSTIDLASWFRSRGFLLDRFAMRPLCLSGHEKSSQHGDCND